MQASEEEEEKALLIAESQQIIDSLAYGLDDNILRPLVEWLHKGRDYLKDDDIELLLTLAAKLEKTNSIRVLWSRLSDKRKECFTKENAIIRTPQGGPLGWAVHGGRVGSVRYLRDEFGASVNHFQPGYQPGIHYPGTPLSIACAFSDRNSEELFIVDKVDEARILQMIRMLILECGANPNLCLEHDGESWVCDALPRSISRGMINVVRFLLDQGADPNMDRGWESVADTAIRFGQPDILRLLWKRGLVVDERTIQEERKNCVDDSTSLYTLVQGQTDNSYVVTDKTRRTITRMLIKDAKSNESSASLLDLALQEAMDKAIDLDSQDSDRLNGCKLLFKAGMDPKKAMYRAIQQGNDDHCRLLAERWVDPFQEADENSNNDGMEDYASSPVHEAARQEDTRILQLFLDQFDKYKDHRSSLTFSDHVHSICQDPKVSNGAVALLAALAPSDANPEACKRLSLNKIEETTTKKNDGKPEVMHADAEKIGEQVAVGATAASTALAATVNAGPAVEPLDPYDDMPPLMAVECPPPKNGIWLLVPRHDDDRVVLRHAFVDGSQVKSVKRSSDFPKGSAILSAQDGIIWVYAPSTSPSNQPDAAAADASVRKSSTTNTVVSWDLHRVRDINSTVTMYTVSKVGAESASLVVDDGGAVYLLLPTDPSNLSTCDRTLFRINSQYEKGKQILDRLVPCHSRLYRDSAGGVWVHVPKTDPTSTGVTMRTNEDSGRRLSPGIWYITPFAAVCVVSQASHNVIINVDGSRTGLLLLSPKHSGDDDDESSTSLLVHIGPSGELHRRTIPVNFANVETVLDDGDNGALVHCLNRNNPRWQLCRVPWEDSSAPGQGVAVADDQLEKFIDCPRRTKVVTDGNRGVWLWKKVGKSSNRAVSYVSPSGKLTETEERFPVGSVME